MFAHDYCENIMDSMACSDQEVIILYPWRERRVGGLLTVVQQTVVSCHGPPNFQERIPEEK